MAGGTSTPFGFRPFRHLMGGTPNRFMEYPIATGYGTAIGTGDPVALISDGTITQCAANTRVLGVFMGVDYLNADGEAIFSAYWPASTTATDIKAHVIVDNAVTYEVQSNKSSAPVQDDVGLLADHVTAVPSTLHGGSGAVLSSTQATGDAQWRILSLIKKPTNTGAQYDTVEVSVWESELAVRGDESTPGV